MLCRAHLVEAPLARATGAHTTEEQEMMTEDIFVVVLLVCGSGRWVLIVL